MVASETIKENLKDVLSAFGKENAHLEVFGNGLINTTWKLTSGGEDFILQKINDQVFSNPEDVSHNIQMISGFLSERHPDYYFVRPLVSLEGKEMVGKYDQGYFRLFPFVKNSRSLDVVKTPEQAYEAAVQFGRFTRLLSEMDASVLKLTIPDFHNLDLRFRQFKTALRKGNLQRVKQSKGLIDKIQHHVGIVTEYERITCSSDFKKRVTHHDTKISNILFDHQDKGICVIDLDTVMPGYFISDLGDMMRTYLSPVDEEEKELDKIQVRPAFYQAVVEGYGSEMNEVLTRQERKYFFYAGQFMIYMQALRFITDHFNNDRYYGARYDGHNERRAANQLNLLEKFVEQRDRF